MKLILGTQSARRHEILSFFNLDFQIIASSFDEKSVSKEGGPEAFVRAVSRGKAAALSQNEGVIITADTIVVHRGNILEKPEDEDEAISILKSLSDDWHTVLTSLTVLDGDHERTGIEETRVQFNPLNDQQINLYHKAISSTERAGAYTIEKAGSLVVKKIEGCFYNVMGLPIQLLRELLTPSGIDLWDHFPG